ncbi:MAG TPA: glycoside hydrolase family 2 TIM barrel-domain containing protein, partial [Candidatus Sulfotelmatobacter sp.]|nr:glycoside hydrolase family 2 TIM barrel-domain containing protein [Candidatus Sulfotelmatobacter sp.]
GAGTPHPYWPDSVWFPSYPAAWDHVQMGWLRRTFRIPQSWGDKRVVLHFEAVAGGCQVLINGKPAGEHFENFLPFDLEITSLVHRYGDNELLVGVRHPHLFDKTNPKYPLERATYATGSNLDGIVGIWQDVYLLGLPPVRVDEVFVQPWVDRDELLVETTLRNDTDQPQKVKLGGTVSSWINEAEPLTPALSPTDGAREPRINEAGQDFVSAPEPKWRLGDKVLTLPGQTVQIPAGKTTTVTLKMPVKNRLKLWSPDTPNLYGLVLTLNGPGNSRDTRYQRFGWRQFRLQDSVLLLNGRPFQVVADILHPFGVVVHSRRHAWAWYRLIKEVGGNGVRLHAQPWPAYYQDLADEMGVVVLAETGLFGSSLKLNFSEPISWQRFGAHYDAMVRRDRNHPSVFGWSFGNELFAIFDYNHMSKEDRDTGYAKLAELGRRSFRLDPTREWISCDGDEDLRGTMPVWAKHFGHGLPLDRLPKSAKALMVGESGGTYYAKPSQLVEFNGERAYESYASRNEALAIDVYQNIVHMARPRLAYFSASELAWFGIEHLPLGYHDFTRLPTRQDGVFFKPFEEGKPGMQPERLSPYCTTLNPGYDPALPLLKPLAMFQAMQAALAKPGPQPCPWDHKPAVRSRPPGHIPTLSSVGFLGDRAGQLFARLSSFGVPFVAEAADARVNEAEPLTPALSPSNGAREPRVEMLIVDGETLTLAQAEEARPRLEALLAHGGQVLVCFRRADVNVGPVNRLLPAPIALTPRAATALVGEGRPKEGRSSKSEGRIGEPPHPGPLPIGWGEGEEQSPFALAELYFAENSQDRHVLKCGLDGAFVRQGRVVLKASNTDWSQFNDVSEVAKCAAVVLYESLSKPAGAALAEMDAGPGRICVSSIDYLPTDRAYARFWCRLLQQMDIKLNAGGGRWLLPVAPVKPVVWRYTTNAPAAGWERESFDAGAWASGPSGFGTDVPHHRSRTRWTSPDIWLRTSFDVAGEMPGELKLVLYHDEDVEVYLNGERLFAETGFYPDYKEVLLPTEIGRRLKPAGNVLAVHCRQHEGGQYIDVGLAQGLVFPDDNGTREHDLLLNGPKN